MSDPENQEIPTYKITQTQVKGAVDLQTQKKIFDLSLDTGSFRAKYDRTGRYLLLGGRKGFFALTDWKYGKVLSEKSVAEEILDVCHLQTQNLFAIARKSHTYIYDTDGHEIHRLPTHNSPKRLAYAQYHMLLTTANVYNHVAWQDVTSGLAVGDVRVKGAPIRDMKINEWNATIAVGQTNGVVSFYSPNSKETLLAINTGSSINAIDVSRDGKYLATVSNSPYVKLWDIRNTYETVYSRRLYKGATEVAISQLGKVATGRHGYVEVWDPSSHETTPYMIHNMPRRDVTSLHFCPYEDVLGIGHDAGFSSIVIPGSGDPNINSTGNNPYASKGYVRERQIKDILEKLPVKTIMLDPTQIASASNEVRNTVQEEVLIRKKTEIELKDARMRNKTIKQGKIRESLRREDIRKVVAAKEKADSRKTEDDFLAEGRQYQMKLDREQKDKERVKNPLSRFK